MGMQQLAGRLAGLSPTNMNMKISYVTQSLTHSQNGQQTTATNNNQQQMHIHL